MVMTEQLGAATALYPGKEAPVPLGRRLCRDLRFFWRPRWRK